VYHALVEQVDAIVHCGAAVNWVYSYAALRAANVCGTTELLRLACRAGASFHFVSSLSACYAQDGPVTADETFDALPLLRRVHLGYAQTKIVGEALVREARARGLAARIYRPALISGHSETGAYNQDDLIATLIRGCVIMGIAPDLDWRLDALPVDTVANSIVELSREDRTTFHLAHPCPRHWRECVLWMRLYGYDVRLVSYPTWLRRVNVETSANAAHPLRPLRSFFTARPPGARGLTLPELYEESRRTHADSSATQSHLAASGVRVPALDATLLDTYFRAFIERGDLRPAGRVVRPGKSTTPVGRVFRRDANPAGERAAALAEAVRPGDLDLEILSANNEHSIISELTSWRSQRPSGVWRAWMTTADGTRRDVIVKLKASGEDVVAVGEAIADVVDPKVAAPYRRCSRELGFTGSQAREIAIARQHDPRFVAHSPHLFASVADEATGTWLLVQERIADGRLLDSANEADLWARTDIAIAVDGLATLQAIWFDREDELRTQPWIGHVHSADSMHRMSDLWIALAAHAERFFSSWADAELATLNRRLADNVLQWWQPLERHTRTLIHGDFNPRNICLRGTPARLCAYDWELATVGIPQRDLAEFLCFVLSPETAGDTTHWIERHRRALSRVTGSPIDRARWMAGFQAAMCDLLINRLAIYAMVQRVRPQPFLPRVVRTWWAIAQATGCEALA
jgi:thioester reductase-like protein